MKVANINKTNCRFKSTQDILVSLNVNIIDIDIDIDIIDIDIA